MATIVIKPAKKKCQPIEKPRKGKATRIRVICCCKSLDAR